VDNAATVAAIEVSLGGIEVTVDDGAIAVAVAGGEFAITLDGQTLPPAVTALLEPGAKLRLRAGNSGSWCYLAVAGGFDLPPVLGSVSTHTRTAIGGLDGRALLAGDRLAIGSAQARQPSETGLIVAPLLDRPADTIRVILGPQADYFAKEQIEAFLAGPWKISARGDRMACFLEGPRLTHAKGFNIASDGIAMGAIQVPGEGQPIVLMADRQSTGGYPKIATIIGPDLGRLAQARAGTTIRFKEVTHAEAVAARAQESSFLAGPIGIEPLIRTRFTSEFLLGLNLIDGYVDARAGA
jgi:5-oxoprolinase (ATP-hydrolysing) subunit C